MTTTRRPVSTIVLIGLSETNIIMYYYYLNSYSNDNYGMKLMAYTLINLRAFCGA